MMLKLSMKCIRFIGDNYPSVSKILLKSKLLTRFVNTTVLEFYVNAAKPRPRPFSLASNYTSWRSLTDRSFTSRHLRIDESNRVLPDLLETEKLWKRRKGIEIPSKDTSVLFGYFAQWFTDSFLRTNLEDRRKNTSNHEIDLCQIYGLNEEATSLLRLKRNGKLRYQLIDGEVYPPFLFSSKATLHTLMKCETDGDLQNLFKNDRELDENKHLPNFSKLHPLKKLKMIYRGVTDDNLQLAFATGLEHGNSSIGYTSINIMFLREHNRICDLLIAEYGDMGLEGQALDDLIFEKARNIMIVLLLNIILQDYVAQVGGFSEYGFNLELDRTIGEGAAWKRSNWISIEFDLLYRWHSLIPEKFDLGKENYKLDEMRNNPKRLLEYGVDSVIKSASTQLAGKIGLLNTHEMFFKPIPMSQSDIDTQTSIQSRTIQMSRNAKLQPYNAYRKHFGLNALKSFDELTDDPFLRNQLEMMYKDIDNLEWFVGIFAEKHQKGKMLGELLLTMVAYDAFTHALSNPLLAPEVFCEETFTPLGMKLINETTTFAQLAARNSPSLKEVDTSFNTEIS